MRCGKHIMPETGVERFTYSGAALYPPFRATEPQPPRGAHAVAVSTTGLRHRDDLVAAPPRWDLRGSSCLRACIQMSVSPYAVFRSTISPRAARALASAVVKACM